MEDFFEERKGIIHVLVVLLVLVWTFATLPYGLYVDENGLLSIYKGIYQGQHMFTDSWAPLQTGGLLAYPLIALYYQVWQPLFAELSLNIGLVLYMRYCYMFIRLVVAIYVYVTLRNSDFEEGAFPASLFYFMFVTGWKDFSYMSYCDIGMMLIICFLIRFYDNRKSFYAVLTAIAVCITVLAYPTMIIMALFLGAYWLYMVIKDEAHRAAVISYVIVCVVIGVAVTLYLQFTTGWGGIVSQISYLLDQEYDNPVYIRLGYMLIQYAVFAAIAYLPIIIIRVWDKVRGVEEETEKNLLTLYFLLFMVAILLFKVEGISTSRFIYGCLVVFFWFPYFMRDKERTSYTRIGSYRNAGAESKQILWTIFVFSAVAQLVWAISTNHEVAVPGHMALYVVIAMILLFSKEDIEYRGMISLLIILGMFFNGVWVADHNGGFETVFTPMYYVERGELKGLALPEDEYNKNEAVMDLLEENVTAEDKLLVAFGTDCAGYLNSEASQGTYSVYARTQDSTKIIEYYELNQDNMADYMLLDKSSDKYQYFEANEAGQYLLGLFTNEVAKEGDMVLLAR